MKVKYLILIVVVLALAGAIVAVQKPVTHVAMDREAFYKASGATETEIVESIKGIGRSLNLKQCKYFKYTGTRSLAFLFSDGERHVKTNIDFYYVKYDNQILMVYKPKLEYLVKDGLVVKPVTPITCTVHPDQAWLMQHIVAEKKLLKHGLDVRMIS